MKAFFRILLLFLLLPVIFSQMIHSQKIEVTQGDEEPYLLNQEGENFTKARGFYSRKKKKSMENATSTYFLVYPGPNGRIANLSSEELARTGIQKELKFPSLYFTLSAASKLLVGYSDSTGRLSKKAKSYAGLRQLALRVDIQGYDKNKRPLKKSVESRFGSDPVMTLSTYPSDTSYGSSKTSAAIQRTSDKVDAVAQHLGPLGSIATSVTAVFRTFFPRKDHISQIAYMESETIFGWIWRDAEGSPIEGIHKCMALLRVHKEVKYLKVRVKVITDWRKFGAWVKNYYYLIPVKKQNDL